MNRFLNQGSRRIGTAATRVMRFSLVVTLITVLLNGCSGFTPATPHVLPPPPPPPGMYTNPLRVQPTAVGPFESCADPAIIRGQQSDDPYWYVYCTDNPLNGADRTANGKLKDHYIPILRSRDLVDWMYVGDALRAPPTWLGHFNGLWAPDIQYFNGQYYLYYTVVGTPLPVRESAIGVATSLSPLGPWTDSGAPVVESQPGPSGFDARRWVIDSAVIADDEGQRYLFYGSFVGGIAARRLSADGLHTDPDSETPIASANRYEAASIVKHGGEYVLFASAGECCNGPLSGYGVFVGRAPSVLGPYVDREGVSLLAGQVGGTPVLRANGNRWIGPGSNTVFTDTAGQNWVLYHAVDRPDPYFAGSLATKRPVLLDRLDWIDGWPAVRGGLGPSDTPQPAPMTGALPPAGTVADRSPVGPFGPLDGAVSLDFATAPANALVTEATVSPGGWQWIRPPALDTVSLVGGELQFATQDGDLTHHTASILTAPTPAGEYAIETHLHLDLPPEGCCQDFVQAGLIIYGDDDNYLKLVQVSREQTRQVIFTKAVGPVPRRTPHEGNAVVGPADTDLYLRIVKHSSSSEETYTAFSSRDGVEWVQGSTWTATLGNEARIGLVAMGGTGFVANFAYLRVYLLSPP